MTWHESFKLKIKIRKSKHFNSRHKHVAIYLSAIRRCELFTRGQQSQSVKAAGILKLGQCAIESVVD